MGESSLSDDKAFVRRAPAVGEDMRFQRRFWAVQRAGWGVLSVMLVLAGLGLFSNGPLSRAEARSANGTMAVEYQRFLRNGAAATMVVRLAAGNGPAEFFIGREALDKLGITRIQPPPSHSSVSDDGIRLAFARIGDAPARIQLTVKPMGFGRLHVSLRNDDAGDRLEYSAFIYP